MGRRTSALLHLERTCGQHQDIVVPAIREHKPYAQGMHSPNRDRDASCRVVFPASGLSTPGPEEMHMVKR